ncbi:DNA alkylation repair protein, partial [Enterococcus innesii]
EKKLDAKVDWPTVWALWYLPEREFQYLALDYLRKMKKYLQASDLEKIKKLALSKSWWDTVDSLDELVGFLLLQERSQGLQE